MRSVFICFLLLSAVFQGVTLRAFLGLTSAEIEEGLRGRQSCKHHCKRHRNRTIDNAAIEKKSSSSSSQSTMKRHPLEASPSQKAVWALPHIFILTNGFSKIQDNTYRLLIRLVSLCIDHKRSVNSVAFNHDGTRLVTGSKDGFVRIMDTQTGVVQRAIQHDHAGCSVAVFNHDGTKLATGFSDGLACVFDVRTGEVQCGVHHGDEVKSVVFNRDGTKFAAADSFNTAAAIMNIKKGEIEHEIRHKGRVSFVVLNHDGTKLVVACKHKSARIINAQTGVEEYAIQHGHWVNSVAFSRDGTKLATGSNDRYVRIIDVKTGEVEREIKHEDWVTSVAFNHDGTKLATRCKNGYTHIINLPTGVEECAIRHGDWINSVAFNHDGTRLAIGCKDGYACISEMKDLQKLNETLKEASRDQCELLEALALAKRDSEELAAQRAEEMRRLRFDQKLLQKFGFGPENPPHKVARINASEDHWEMWLTLQGKLPERVIKRLAPFIVRGDDNPDGYETAEE